jgi:putative transposase
MKKEYRKMERNAKGKIREIQGGRVTVEIPLPIADVLIGVTESVEELAREVGLMVISATMESEAEQIAGKKNTKNPARRANWWGEQIGHVYYEGQKVLIEHPRIRSKENTEIPLKTYNAFQGPKAIRKSLVRDIILGISSRNYEESIEKLLNGYGVKKSSVSRHFIKATSEQMRAFLERSLAGLRLCAILIDGIEFKGDLLVVALGLEINGHKHVLGLWQGATENTEVCKNLLEDMERRGLDTSKDYLFVLDGSKALRSAITKMFGQDVAVQRCQLHKRRNVREHLPPEHQEAVDARIRAAYNMTKYEDAKKSLDLTVKYLETLNPSAASSLKEGMEETLTMHKLGAGELLRKTLSSTNAIESCFSITRAITDRVKRWKKGNMVQRWAVAALLRAEKKFKRVKGYKDIPKLLIALKEVSLMKKNLDRKEMAA